MNNSIDLNKSFTKLKNQIMNNDLQEQIVNISKAAAYDILQGQYKRVKIQHDGLREDISSILDVIGDMNPSEIANNPSILIGKISKICSDSLLKNMPL